MSNFDVPVGYVPPTAPEIWNREPGCVVRPRMIEGMRNGCNLTLRWSALPFDLVGGGQLRVITLVDHPKTDTDEPQDTGSFIGCVVFSEPTVLRVGDPIRIDGNSVGHLTGFADSCVVVQSWHGFCGGELECSTETQVEIGGPSR